MPQTSKPCRLCGETKPLEQFSRNKRFKDGRERRCRTCRSVAYEAWRVKHLDERREYQREWYARNPEAKRQHDAAHRQRHAEKRRASAREWREANPEHYRASHRAWRAANRDVMRAQSYLRRARERGAPGTATAEQIRARVEYYGGKCWICGAPWEHIDHVKPLARGGSNWPANLRPACSSCNYAKGSKWPFADGK